MTYITTYSFVWLLVGSLDISSDTPRFRNLKILIKRAIFRIEKIWLRNLIYNNKHKVCQVVELFNKFWDDQIAVRKLGVETTV